jgi:hypothetical protein
LTIRHRIRCGESQKGQKAMPSNDLKTGIIVGKPMQSLEYQDLEHQKIQALRTQ